MEDLVAPYVADQKARAPDKLVSKLAPAFLYAFEEIVKDEKHEKGWKAFQRDLAWAMHQQILALRTGQEEILAKLKEIHEGKIALPDIITRGPDLQCDPTTSAEVSDVYAMKAGVISGHLWGDSYYVAADLQSYVALRRRYVEAAARIASCVEPLREAKEVFPDFLPGESPISVAMAGITIRTPGKRTL